MPRLETFAQIENFQLCQFVVAWLKITSRKFTFTLNISLRFLKSLEPQRENFLFYYLVVACLETKANIKYSL